MPLIHANGDISGVQEGVLAARDSPHVDSVRVSGKRFEILFHATRLRGRVNVSFGAAAAATMLVMVVVRDDQDRSLVPGTGVYRDVMLRHRSRSRSGSGRRREPLRWRCASRRSLRLFARALSQNACTAPVCGFGRSGVSSRRRFGDLRSESSWSHGISCGNLG